MLDVKDSTVTALIKKLLRSIPHSWVECMQLEIEERAKAEPGNPKRKKLHLTSPSAGSSAAAIASQIHSVPLDDSPVRLVWGYVLRQLQRVGEEHAQWQLLDTSQSGVTGHSGKGDFCFSAVQQKAWPQVVAMAELKQDLQTESQHTECIGRLSARSQNIFINQPHRKHVMMIAGGLDGLEIIAFFKDQSILCSGLQPWSLHPSCRGLRWLCKLLFSSLPAMGFMPELPPLINTTPKGLLRAMHVLVALGRLRLSGALVAVQVCLSMTWYSGDQMRRPLTVLAMLARCFKHSMEYIESLWL